MSDPMTRTAPRDEVARLVRASPASRLDVVHFQKVHVGATRRLAIVDLGRGQTRTEFGSHVGFQTGRRWSEVTVGRKTLLQYSEIMAIVNLLR